MSDVTKHWLISVGSWGTLYAIGTEDQAEAWRRHKANWEHSVGTKRLATAQEILGQRFQYLSDLIA